uniref:Uncharacterized protein n=1 Tax=Anguilla anguilla TaxID=7936 RepID=A0A0E9XFQ5_ANGAN
MCQHLLPFPAYWGSARLIHAHRSICNTVTHYSVFKILYVSRYHFAVIQELLWHLFKGF